MDPATSGNSYAYHRDTTTTSLYVIRGKKETATAVPRGISAGTGTVGTAYNVVCNDGDATTAMREASFTGREWGCPTPTLNCGD